MNESPAAPLPETGQWLRTDMATFEAAYQLLLCPPRVRAGALVLLGSMVLFLVAGAIRNGDWLYTILLVIVILIHELGHYAGMRWFGYEDVQMFFIPLVGAAVSGRPKATTAWKDGIVTLLGPLPGIVLAVVLTVWMAARSEDQPLLREFANLLVVINLFNLLPIGPLDGGRLFQRTLFSRSLVLEVGFEAISGTLLILFGLWQTSVLLVFLGGFTLAALVPRYHAVSAARWLRSTNPALPSDPAALHPDQRFALFTAARTIVPDADNADPQKLSGAMRHLLDSFHVRPSFAATISLLAAWGGGVVAALAAGSILVVAGTPAHWARYECPDLRVGAEFPAEPASVSLRKLATPVGDRDGRGCMAVHRGASIYSITLIPAGSTIDQSQRLAWVSSFGPGARVGGPVMADGLEAVDVAFDSAELGTHRLVFAGSMVLKLSAFGSTPEDARRFIESFRRSP